MIKRALLFFYLGFGLSSSAANDSTLKYVKKFSIGFDFIPIDYSKWSFPNSYKIFSWQNSSTGKQVDNTKQINIFRIYGLSTNYSITPTITVGLGLFIKEDRLSGLFVQYTLSDSIRKSIYLNNYKCKYASFPISINFHLPDNTEKRSFTNIHASFSFDFIYAENDISGDVETYNYYTSQKINETLHPNVKHNFRNSLHRIVPSLYIGRERLTKNKRVSFTYGSQFSFHAIYQNKVTLSYYKNYIISPCVIGCKYYF